MREDDGVCTTQIAVILAIAGWLLLTSLGITASAKTNPDIIGPARVIDGDTIDIDGQRIRLEGIDAPEANQYCIDAHGGQWRCGSAARSALLALVGGATLRCTPVGQDRYNRVLGKCYLGPVDINASMVSQGLAWAFVKYSQTYVSEEAEARAIKRGIWQGASQPAWEFREHGWHASELVTPGGCAIKGNKSRSGLIYHMPWNPYYSKVKIDVTRGERYFCSEVEAIRAGWRPAGTF